MSTTEEPRKHTYLFSPESSAEMTRLLGQERELTRAMGQLPSGFELHEGDRVLDVACGPGGWARSLATSYPQAQVMGIDISQRMIEYAHADAQARQLSNASFQVMDVLTDWNFADASFNVVHGRTLAAFLTREKWQHVLAEMLRVLVPGGTIILTETDDAGRSNSPALERLGYLAGSALKRTGLSQHPLGHHFGITPLLGYFLRLAGCEQIQREAHVIDYSAGAPAHRAILEDLGEGYKHLKPYLVRTGVATPEEFDQLYERLLEEWAAPEFRSLLYFLRIQGKKPA